MPLTDQEARKQAKKEKEFYVHLAVYISVMTGLALLNFITSVDHLWFLYPLLGWGIGVASHAADVFGLPGMGATWEERRIEALTGQESEEARMSSLRRLLDEELEGRAALPQGDAPSIERMQRRIEHLEAIVTSQDWDALEASDAPRALESGQADADDPESVAARLARRVR